MEDRHDLEDRRDTTGVTEARTPAAAPVRKSSAVFGALLVLLSLFVWWETSHYSDDLLDVRKMTGPGTFPRLLTMFLGLTGAWEILRALRTGQIKLTESWKSGFAGVKSLFGPKSYNIWAVIIMTALFIPMTRYLGFSFGAMIYMLVLMARLKAKPWQAVLSSLLAVAFVVVIFNYVFRVSLPVGLLTEPLGWRY